MSNKTSQQRWAEKNPNYYKEYYQKHKAKYIKKARKRYKDKPEEWRRLDLRKKYNLSLEEYEELLLKQDYVCAICFGDQTIGKSLAVDHCHSTGKVRGLLCDNCNRALGQFKDDPKILIRASKYLTR